MKEKMDVKKMKLKGKILAFLLTVIMIVAEAPVGDAKAAGDNMSNATQIYANNWYYGTLDNSNKTDFYKITLTSAGRLSINASAEMSVCYYLYDNEGSQLDYKFSTFSDVMGKSTYEKVLDLTKGTYYFSVEKGGSSDRYNGDYSFQYEFKSAGESFAESQGGSNNNMISANKIELGKSYKGQIAKNDYDDFYKFTINKTGSYTFNVNSDMKWIGWKLYDSKGNQTYKKNFDKDEALGKIKSDFEFEIETPGTYYVSLSGMFGDGDWFTSYYTGNYTFNISAKLNPVYIDTVKNTASGIKVSWGKVKNATGYIVYRKAGSGSWKKLAATSSVGSYVDKTAKSGGTYSYKVIPTMGSVTGKNGNTRKMTYVALVKPTYVKSNGKGKLTLKWKTNKKLSGYQIQYSTNKKFSGAKTKQVSKSKSKYAITKLKSRKYYYVRMRACKRVGGIKYYSAWSTVKKVKIK
ncbi:MAG: fibronectin type III domain-containing protein [Muribaculaceae bacterium]|nr:fibronectin type III domain-containing protein [Muribaculaceae bacterium]MCM1398957.1 fibronectin type III domain-containing protein [Clostridium sp.]MCM1458815.1 fibronectin type III domain-containing protein [Bacteroides sp.]